MDWIAIGRQIKARREAMGLTKQQLADAAKVSRQTVDFVERAQRTNTTPDTLRSIAQCVGLDVDVVLVDLSAPRVAPEDQELLAEVARCLATVPEASRRLAVRQLRRWLEDFDPKNL